jgi:hypothetical protein
MFRSSTPEPSPADRQTYIPPHIESAMAEHVQQNLPPHLQKYRGGNTYVPQHAQAEIASHLEESLPPHMKQYAGAYVQQQVVEPSLARRGAAADPAETQPVPQAVPGQSISPSMNGMPAGASAVTAPGVPSAGQVQPPAGSVMPSAPAAPTQSPDQAYAFITNPEKPVKPSPLSSLLTGGSLIARIGVIGGALLILLILFAIVRGIFGGGQNLDSLLTVVQEQQELIHLTTTASQEPSLATGNKNLAATIQSSLTSSQSATLTYMSKNGKKIKTAQLNQKVSATTDTQLKNATSAGNYNQVFRDVIQTQLNAYSNALNAAYGKITGPKGRDLLRENYRQLQLYQVEFKETANQ